MISSFFFKFGGGAFPDSGRELGAYTDRNPILGERINNKDFPGYAGLI